MWAEMWKALRFYWMAAKGYRLRPWRSPYLLWRLETFFGKEAAGLSAGRFFRLTWKERARIGRFLEWAEERRREQRRGNRNRVWELPTNIAEEQPGMNADEHR